MTIVFVGMDLAKNVFAVHGVKTAGKAERGADQVRPNVPRAKLHALISRLPACTIGMVACSGAHHWARRFQALGDTVKLMAPKHGIGGTGQGRQISDAGLSAQTRRCHHRPAGDPSKTEYTAA